MSILIQEEKVVTDDELAAHFAKPALPKSKWCRLRAFWTWLRK